MKVSRLCPTLHTHPTPHYNHRLHSRVSVYLFMKHVFPRFWSPTTCATFGCAVRADDDNEGDDVTNDVTRPDVDGADEDEDKDVEDDKAEVVVAS